MIHLPLGRKEKFLLFFLTTYIDDIFSNLLLDAPYSEDIKVAREELFSQIGTLFQQLNKAYKGNNDEGIFEILQELAKIYLEKIDKLNLITMEAK